MILKFLGTSSGLPTHSRNVSGLAVQFEQESNWMLFDCGEATQHQLLSTRFSPAKLQRIFITHLHGDHVYGLFGLLATRSLNGCEAPIKIIGPPGIKEMVETILSLSKCNLIYDLDFYEIKKQDDTFKIPKAKVDVLEMEHSIKTFAFSLKENEKRGRFKVEKAEQLGIKPGPIYGKLKNGKEVKLASGKILDGKNFVGDPIPGRKVIIAGDNQKPELLLPYLQDCDLFVHEASYTEEVKEKVGGTYFHSTAKKVAQIAEKGGVKNLILTHFSARFSLDFSRTQLHTMQEIDAEVGSVFSGNYFLAKDFDEYFLSRDGVLSKRE